MGKPEGKRPLGRSRHRRENIKMDLQDVRCGGMGWTDVAQGRNMWWALVNMVLNLQVPLNAENFLTSSELVRFSRSTVLHGEGT